MLYIYIYIYMYVFMNHESNVLSSLSPRRLCCNSCTWTHELYMSPSTWVAKVIVFITKRAHCFHDSIYIMPILLMWSLSTLCVVDHLWPQKKKRKFIKGQEWGYLILTKLNIRSGKMARSTPMNLLRYIHFFSCYERLTIQIKFG